MPIDRRTIGEVLAENEELRLRLEEAEQTLGAIQRGEVDALVVETPQGDRIYTLQGAEHPYRILVESMNEGAAILDLDGTIRYCNNRLATMLQVPLEKLIGTLLNSYVAPLDMMDFVATLDRCQEEQGTAEVRLITYQGDSLSVHLSCRALMQDGIGISAVITDLSEKKYKDEVIASRTTELATTLEELQEKEHMLLMQSRMAAMGEMIGNIAHQWRQPLNSLSLTVQQLRLYYDMGRFSKEYLDKSVDSSMKLIQHMSDTIDDFRNFFIQDKEKTEFKVKETVNNALKLLEGALKNENISVEANLSDDVVIQGYPNEFAQAILNLITNAKDAFEERRPEDPTIAITAVNEGGKAVVTIRDNAGGIPEDIIEKVFDPHFSTKGSKGTGIGLFMAKNIVERNMNGRLTVLNSGGGAKFRIEV